MSTKRPPRQAASPLWAKLDARMQSEIQSRHPRAPLVQRAEAAADNLEREFPAATCALHHTNAFELLVATILSAQCTDERVNMVTPRLFAKYKTIRSFAEAPPGELEREIHSTGFFNNKARAIREMARDVLSRFDGKIPVAMEDLITLRGVARKTASVVRVNAFGLPGITVDTHYSRITVRLGLTKATDPERIEFDTAVLLMPERYAHFSHAVILHGRKTCKARNPLCEDCPLAGLCPSRGKC